MRNINNPALQAECLELMSHKSNLVYQGHTGLCLCTVYIRSFVLTAIFNENTELSHKKPAAAARPQEAVTLATLLIPIMGLFRSVTRVNLTEMHNINDAAL